ncbi:hypothetical protein PIB30_028591 [Stylosanthes scabra]|uniref:Uncharacterized protein n=1 Tax=Stylosanthes scabra TaxID=79078 RepID=A0ABU6W9M1_9FABA|nr:hypothetical protein [Stylosanthes scabra]
MAVNRETDENGKPIVVVGTDYSWVKGEVRELSSWFLDTDNVEQIGDPSTWAKGVRKRGTVTLNSVQNKALFGLYRQSYKDFKEIFIKVTCSEDQFPFYLDEFGLERFPLYWYSEPVQILGMNKVNRESLEVIEFLEKHVCTKELLSLTMVFKWEKEREYATRYLETTTGGLKNYFKNKSERGFSASNAVKVEEGTVVNKPPEKKKVLSMKRRRVEEVGSSKKVIDLTSSKCCGKDVSLEEVKGFAEKQKRLHGYAGEEDLTSVWSEHFPFSVLAEEHFQSKTDLDLIGSVDSVCAARLFCLGRFEELKAKEEVKQKKEKGLEMQKALEAERKLEVATEQLAVKEKEMLELKTTIEGLKGKLQKFEKDKTELEARVVELAVEKKEAEQSKEDHDYDMMAAGFERARKQAEFFFPDLKFDQLNPIKVVHKGAHIDDDEVDLEGGDDHDPKDGEE